MTEGQPLFVCEECGEMGTDQGVHPGCQCQLKPIVCHRCDEPILSGQPRYTAGEYQGRYSHYDCKKLADDKLDRDLRNLKGKHRATGAALADLFKRLKL